MGCNEKKKKENYVNDLCICTVFNYNVLTISPTSSLTAERVGWMRHESYPDLSVRSRAVECAQGGSPE
jgi:hypothetical protein